jgi:Exodeoxyribonuclease III (EC 3.1.11.2)
MIPSRAMLYVATWNVNSIRSRLEQVLAWLAINPHIDLLCLQETKVEDSKFPITAFHNAGYQVSIYGQKSYNGVALVSKQPLADVRAGFGAVLPEMAELDQQKRLLSAKLDGVRVVNLYVPNGSAIASEKYYYKLAWLDSLAQYLSILRQTERDILLCGDFNVALTDLDIHDPSDHESSIMASPAERSALEKVLRLGFVDIFRQHNPEGGHYSWWDYRAGSFRRNLGWRIDYHFPSVELAQRVTQCQIDVSPRRNEQPSDHAPVIIGLADANSHS